MNKVKLVLLLLVLVSLVACLSSTFTNTPPKEVLVSEGYFFNDYAVVHDENYEPRAVTIIDMPGGQELNSLFSEKLNMEVVKTFCGEECLQINTSLGEAGAVDEWQQNMRFYVLLSDGSYVELAFRPPPPPVCLIRGVYLESGEGEDLLYVHILEFNGVESMSVWSITPQESGDFVVLEVDTLPFVEERYDFDTTALAQSGVAALVSQSRVLIFDTNDSVIGRAQPCAAG